MTERADTPSKAISDTGVSDGTPGHDQDLTSQTDTVKDGSVWYGRVYQRNRITGEIQIRGWLVS